MLRLRRIVGWLAAVLTVLLAAALLGVNLYVQSQGTQARIQQELSQRLGMPLRIQRISITPWMGLRLRGITIPQGPPADGSAFLEAQSFRLRVKFRSIFWRPLVIKDVALIKPAVVWSQNESGKWRLPMTLRPSESAPMAAEEEAQVASSPNAVIDSTAAPPIVPAKQSAQRPSNSPQVRRVRLIDGSFHFLDRARHNVALFDGVEFSSTMRDANSIRGEARVAKIALRDRVFLSGLRSPIRYDPTLLDLSAIRARIAKGGVTGNFSMQPQAVDSPFTVQATFREVEADQLVVEAGGPKEMVRGILEGTLNVSGKIAEPNAVTGEGTVTLRAGHVQQFAVLAALGQLLQIEELTQLDLQQAEAKFRLGSGRVSINDLILRSPNLRLTATGSVSFEGKLALESILAINDKIRGQLFRGIRQNFVATSEPGFYALPFHIGGTLEKPRTDLMERAVGSDLKDLGGVIDALLGRNKTKKKKNVETPSPAPTEAPTP